MAYLFLALPIGVAIEIVNSLESNVSGIGFIFYILMMIFYFQIFPRKRVK